MDARRILVLVFFLTLGCAQEKSGKLNNNDLNHLCKSQVRQGSFLVRWKSHVPQEFESFRIHPQSLVTRFQNTEAKFVEDQLIAKHLDEFEEGESEFFIQAVNSDIPVNSQGVGQSWGASDIQIGEAWNRLQTTGSNMIIAVVDSGVDVNHPRLKDSIWKNPNEISGNKIDDDRNGYVDDLTGWNFQAESPAVTDQAGHGTHVAGILAAVGGEDGFIGVAPSAKVMPLKFIDKDGLGSVGDAIAAIDYAVAHNAKVINASWGGPQCSELLKKQISQIWQHGTVFVTAAGNSSRNIDFEPEWPAAFVSPGKITIASSNEQHNLSWFSNYGQLVDVAAPGEAIYSTVPIKPGKPTLDFRSGTSMAAPFVSGVAALLLSARPETPAESIVEILNGTSVTGWYNIKTRGRINALAAADRLLAE